MRLIRSISSLWIWRMVFVRLPARSFCAAVSCNQVAAGDDLSDRLGLRQIELARQICACGEFAGTGGCGHREQTVPHNRFNQHWWCADMKFDQGIAGIRMR